MNQVSKKKAKEENEAEVKETEKYVQNGIKNKDVLQAQGPQKGTQSGHGCCLFLIHNT